MKSGFGEHRFASQDRPCDLLSYLRRPLVILVCLSSERHKQASIGDGIHPRENPFREETSLGPPLITPANFLHA